MIKLLFKYLIPLALLVTVTLVGYNYFLGTPEEQQQSKVIIGKVKDLGSEVFNLLHTEKEKYDAGKFDEALNKISSSITYLKQQASNAADGGQALLDQLRQLDQQKAEIESQFARLNSQSDPNGRMVNSSSVSVDSIGERLENLQLKPKELVPSLVGNNSENACSAFDEANSRIVLACTAALDPWRSMRRLDFATSQSHCKT